MLTAARAMYAHVPAQPGETPGWTPPAPEMPDGPTTLPGPEIEQPRGPDMPDTQQPEMPSIDPSPTPSGPGFASRPGAALTIRRFESNTSTAPTRLNA